MASNTTPMPANTGFDLGRFLRRNGLQVGIFSVMLLLWVIYFVSTPAFRQGNIYTALMSTVPYWGDRALLGYRGAATDHAGHRAGDGFEFPLDHGDERDHLCRGQPGDWTAVAGFRRLPAHGFRGRPYQWTDRGLHRYPVTDRYHRHPVLLEWHGPGHHQRAQLPPQ